MSAAVHSAAGHRVAPGDTAAGAGAEGPCSIEQRLAYTFVDRTLLTRACTHATYAHEHPAAGQNYERLEFLGDAVLDLLVGELLFEVLPAAEEGELSRRRAQVVRRETLASLGAALGLAEVVRLGVGQQRVGAGQSERILADAFEALVGAVFLDGGYAAAKAVFAQPLRAAIDRDAAPQDHKTQLQELCHRLGQGAPCYRVERTSGPDHARIFHCEVLIEGACAGRGAGSSKRSAQQLCAQQALGARNS